MCRVLLYTLLYHFQHGVDGASNAVDVQSILDKYFELMTKQPSSEAQRVMLASHA